MDFLIRNEIQDDYRQIQELTKEAFWYLHVPGCNEHYLVNVSDSEGRFPYSLLVLELEKSCLRDHTWKFHASGVYNLDADGFTEFDRHFPPKTKGYRPTQQEFIIASNAFVE